MVIKLVYWGGGRDVLVQIVSGMHVYMFVEVKVDVWHLLDHSAPYILRQGLSFGPRVLWL